jgi:hypothetical protein
MDSCGCVTERKYVSDFLAKQVFRGKGKETGRGEVQGRKFKIFQDEGKFKYQCDQCAVLIITLEATLEEINKGNKNEKQILERIKRIKGLTVNDLIIQTVKEVLKIVN